MPEKIILLILDGWGIGNKTKSDAIYNANTPFIDSLYQSYPNSTLVTSGEAVGLPEGQMGNSEVGHLNIGAGRVVYQQLVLINRAFRTKSIYDNKALADVIAYAKTNHRKVHLIGLVSNGGIHSSIEHLKGLCTMLHDKQVENVFIHAFLDGRDTDPKSGAGFLEELKEHTKITTGRLATVIGRYYAMDRDKRWERIKQAYDLLVNNTGEKAKDAIAKTKEFYAENITDEFMKPTVVTDDYHVPLAKIEDGDVVINFNFRTDRGREITVALTQQDFHEQNMHALDLYYCTLTRYDETFKNVHVVFENDDLKNTFGEVLEKNNKKQIRMAETEKYPHVTFFFSGGREVPFHGETRIMCPSPKVATYDLQPEMSADCLKEKILVEIAKADADFIVLNFANPDMVGHTGVYEAVIHAVEKVDECVSEIVPGGLNKGYEFIIIADHGNADYEINEDGSPNTAHTTNPVPFFYVGKNRNAKVKNGKLADIAPTILKLMGIPVPEEMDGNNLIE